jgi:hypothetical protein
MLTLSRTIWHISADPAFATGMTLISLASWTDFAATEVKSDFRLTFQCVHSQIKLWAVMIVPHQTNVHSEPPICFSYKSGVRKYRKNIGQIITKGQT